MVYFTFRFHQLSDEDMRWLDPEESCFDECSKTSFVVSARCFKNEYVCKKWYLVLGLTKLKYSQSENTLLYIVIMVCFLVNSKLIVFSSLAPKTGYFRNI